MSSTMCQAKSNSTPIKSSGFEIYLSRQDVAVGGLGIPSPRNLERKMDCIAAASLLYNNIIQLEIPELVLLLGAVGCQLLSWPYFCSCCLNVILNFFLWPVSFLTLPADCYRLLANV